MSQTQSEAGTSLEDLWSLGSENSTAIEETITNLCELWDRTARAVGCSGLLKDALEVPVNLDTGAGYVGSQLTEKIQDWQGRGDEAMYQRAIRRIELACYRLDLRFLWCLLDWTVKKGPSSAIAHFTLVQIICQIAPELPFLNAQNWPVTQDTSCFGAEESSLVKCVTRDGLAEILKALLTHHSTRESLQRLYRTQVEENTVLYKAIKWRKPEAVEVLLKVCPEICLQILEAELQMTMLLLSGSHEQDRLLERIARQIVARFPELFHSGDLLATVLEHPNAELAKIYYSFEAVSGGEESYDRIQELIECQTLEDADLLSLPGFSRACLDLANKNTLLHLAIKARRQNLVDFLSQETDGVFTIDSVEHGRKYALWYNNHPDKWTREKLESGSKDVSRNREMCHKKESIRKTLIAAIIRKCDPVQIDEIIDASDDQIREYSFDITGFGKHDLSLGYFVAAFMNAEQQKSKLYRKLKFEELLKYVQFPKIVSTIGDAAHEHDEVREVMEWLWKKGVRIVLQLTVPDRLWGPHNEKCIAETASTFQVETLDWRCQDLSFTCLEELNVTKDKKQRRATDHLKLIHLYSSGKSAVHRYWLGPKGLENKEVFPKLKRAILWIIKDNLPALLIDSAYEELCRLRKESREQHPDSRVRIDIKRYSWHSQQKYIRGDSIQEITSRAFPPQLSNFLKQYRDLQRETKRTRRTRVAILDNGIIAMNRSGGSDAASEAQFTQIPSLRNRQSLTDISDQVIKGKSFVHNIGQRKSSWFIATDPHGSQMAALICALDPYADVLIAKVADHHADVYPDRVAKAIEWAMSNKVDIISMSFVCEQQSGSLQKAVKKAYQKNIVMFASHHDEGLNRAHAYPADYEEIITIAASTPQGDPIYNTKEEKYQYLFPGLNVFVGRVAQLASPETITGSSVATATAAGMASLILSCLRFCNSQTSEHNAVGAIKCIGASHGFEHDETSSDEDEPIINDNTKHAQQPSEALSHHQDADCRSSDATVDVEAGLNNHDGQDGLQSPEPKQSLILPRLDEDTSTTWRADVVRHFFNKMGSGKYVALGHICGLGETAIDLEAVDFESKIVRKWFCDEFALCARGKPWKKAN